ncbi:MAG: UDP-N-acetylglucosamine 2-epimerase [Pseudomonadota bacterium]
MDQRPRRITALTSSRADYAHLYWVLRALQARPELDPEVVLFGAHLSPEFGHTGDLVKQDGFRVRAELECLLSSDSDTGMAKTIGLATLSLADELSHDRPDLLLLIADRYEMLAAASVGLALRIPMAHLEGGEISAGAIDDAVRNALTKLAHLHLTPHEEARRRVIAMGEQAWRVTTSGAPSLDALKHLALKDAETLSRELALPPGPPLVVAWHPLTLASDTNCETDALFAGLDRFLTQWDGPVVFCFPNADAGSRKIVRRAAQWCEAQTHGRLYTNLTSTDYFSLLASAAALVGNSSSGIMESASFRLPCVNVGRRQLGRLLADNIIDVPASEAAIAEALNLAVSRSFAEGLRKLQNPYGDGNAGETIARVLAEAPAAEKLLIKEPTPV